MTIDRTMLARTAAGSGVLLALMLPGAGAVRAATINGAGATFPAPVYTKWAAGAGQAIGVTVNYQAIGSGAGQNQIINGTVNFGASDAPMDPAKLDSNHLYQFPTVMGGVVPIVNLPRVGPGTLKLTGDVLAAIFDGDITSWNDKRIADLNPGVKLPHLAIAPVHRADGSGTTFVFTSYLSAVSDKWKSTTGASTSVAWPSGAGAKGNDGVAGTVHNTRGGVGYVEYAYAEQNHLATVSLRNKDGVFVQPSLDTFRSAAAQANFAAAPHFAVSLIDEPGAKSWPIVSATFIIVPERPKDAAAAANVLKFFNYGWTQGGAVATGLNYVALPASAVELIHQGWDANIKGPDGAKLSY